MRLKKITIVLFALALIFDLSGCAVNDCSNEIAEAKAAFEAKDFKRAQIICDHIATDTIENNFSCIQLCDLSLLYMKLAEAYPDSADAGVVAANVAMATEIFRKAYKICPDSVIDYLLNLDAEESAKSQIVFNLNNAISVSGDSVIYNDTHNTDSVISIDYQYE